jgi:outer membrane lipoprotein-sorting protein
MTARALFLAFLGLFLAGCSHPAQRAAEAIREFQRAADEVGLEEYQSTWSGNVASTSYTVTREDGQRVAEFEHRNTWKPRTYFRTRKPELEGRMFPEADPN